MNTTKSAPAWNWGPFTIRFPFFHFKPSWPEFFQGIFISAATSMALTPVMMGYFGLTFEEAVAAAAVHATFIVMAPMWLGEPYASGWVTAALPFVFSYVLSNQFPTPAERWQAMAALSFVFALLTGVLGIMGWGTALIKKIPNVLKAGIIMGSAIASFVQIFDMNDAKNSIKLQPISTIVALSICLIITFSKPFSQWKHKSRILKFIADLGLLPGFIAAAIIGPIVGEIVYDIQWGFVLPPFGDLWNKASPFAIGWPSWEMYLEVIPLALIGYVLTFGEIVTGDEIIKAAQPSRPDDPIEIDNNRVHRNLCIRNILCGLIAPFFPTQGPLWTGVQIVVVNKWAQGKQAMDNLYGGINSFYLFGLPVIFVTLPLITGIKPLLGIALTLTLGLTGFACAYIAQHMVEQESEKGVAVLIGVALTFFDPWIGLGAGFLASWLIVGRQEKGPA
jgi:hypothetical protein